MPANNLAILRIALPAPLRRLFDYLPPENIAVEQLQLGVRVRVSFGRQQLIGVLVALADHSDIPLQKLKPAQAILDDTPPLTPVLFEIAQWAARYYQYPLGEVFYSLLPHTLREGKNNQLARERHWRAIPSTTHTLRANSKLLALYQWLLQDSATREDILAAGYSSAQIKTLCERSLLECYTAEPSVFDAENLSIIVSVTGEYVQIIYSLKFKKNIKNFITIDKKISLNFFIEVIL